MHELGKRVLNLPTISRMPPTMAVTYAFLRESNSHTSVLYKTIDLCVLTWRLRDGAPSHRSKKTMSHLKGPDWRTAEQVPWPAASPDLKVLDWCVWGQIKRNLVRTGSFVHLRTQLFRVVALLKAQGKLDSASTQAHFLRRLDLCILNTC